VSQRDPILGQEPDGAPWMVPGLSILYYADGGNMPPRKPNSDVSLPEAWGHLEKSRVRSSSISMLS
jgi:hypothetical protein